MSLKDISEGELVAELERRGREVLPRPGHVPQYHLDLGGLTDDGGDDPTSAVQFAAWDGSRHTAYSDQRYVACGMVLRDEPEWKLKRRDITITYGEWTDHHIGRSS